MSKAVPSDAPPSYDQATGNKQSNQAGPSSTPTVSVTDTSHGIPAHVRRSMEDEARPLPTGWVRTYDPESSHQFFVDTTKDPPRSIWTHPYDDPQYLSTLSSEERERLEQESLQHSNSHEAIIADHTDDEDHDDHHSGHGSAELPPRPQGKERSLGRKLKDKLTGTTHEQREAQRAKRAELERQMYEQHRRYREAMTKAAQTGERQLVGKDKNGKDIYVEPPQQGGLGYGGMGYGGMGYGYSPYGYGGSSVYSAPTSSYYRPPGAYARPYGGYGYGRGFGYGPLALGGGLLGGLLLADVLI